MKTSGVNLIKQFETLELTAYYDAVGVLTIGYGHTNSTGTFEVKVGQTITAAKAEEILKADLVQFENVKYQLIQLTISKIFLNTEIK